MKGFFTLGLFLIPFTLEVDEHENPFRRFKKSV
jgi:hypothetical protein